MAAANIDEMKDKDGTNQMNGMDLFNHANGMGDINQKKGMDGANEQAPEDMRPDVSSILWQRNYKLDRGGVSVDGRRPRVALRQRSFQVIQLRDRPFQARPGPPGFKSLNALLGPAANAVVTGGTIGASSHTGVHGKDIENFWPRNTKHPGPRGGRREHQPVQPLLHYGYPHGAFLSSRSRRRTCSCESRSWLYRRC